MRFGASKLNCAEWSLNQWAETPSSEEISVQFEYDNSLYDGIIIQVAQNPIDLEQTKKKCALYRFGKKIKIANLLLYFKRVKSKRDIIPPYDVRKFSLVHC